MPAGANPAGIAASGEEDRAMADNRLDDLLRKVFDGEKDAEDQLMRECRRLVERCAYNRVPRHVVDDIVQDVSLAMWAEAARPGRHPHSPFTTKEFEKCASTVTSHKICDFYRPKRLPREGKGEEEVAETLPDRNPSPDEFVEGKMLAVQVGLFFQRISTPPRYSPAKAAIRQASLELPGASWAELRQHQAVAALRLPRAEADKLISKVHAMMRKERKLNDVGQMYFYQYEHERLMTLTECWEMDGLKHVTTWKRKERISLFDRLFEELRKCFDREDGPAPFVKIRRVLEGLAR
jgi:DNA-directed RNA polymerase specialized sigma24 family protein